MFKFTKNDRKGMRLSWFRVSLCRFHSFKTIFLYFLCVFFFFEDVFVIRYALKLSFKWNFNLSLVMNGRSVAFDFSFALFQVQNEMKKKYFYNFHKHFRSHPVSVVEQFRFLLCIFPSWGSKQQLYVSCFNVWCARNIWNWFLPAFFNILALCTSCFCTIFFRNDQLNEKENAGNNKWKNKAKFVPFWIKLIHYVFGAYLLTQFVKWHSTNVPTNACVCSNVKTMVSLHHLFESTCIWFVQTMQCVLRCVALRYVIIISEWTFFCTINVIIIYQMHCNWSRANSEIL